MLSRVSASSNLQGFHELYIRVSRVYEAFRRFHKGFHTPYRVFMGSV